MHTRAGAISIKWAVSSSYAIKLGGWLPNVLFANRFEIGKTNMANDTPNPGEAQIFDAGRKMSLDTTRLAGGLGWQGSPVQGWVNLLYDTISGQNPNSVQADKRGIALGQFLVEHGDLAKQLEVTRKKFEHHILPDITDKIPDVSITYFENWASTTTGLLLHAKPTTVRQVKYLVKKAKDLGVKVKL